MVVVGWSDCPVSSEERKREPGGPRAVTGNATIVDSVLMAGGSKGYSRKGEYKTAGRTVSYASLPDTTM